ncbi:Aldose 1-epimerase [subsurface metagenome]
MNHYLTVPASTYTELKDLMPTGRIIEVEGTPYDFREEMETGSRINQLSGGYDVNFPLDSPIREVCRFAGRLSEKKSGRYVEVLTTQPALQIYAGSYIPDLIVNGKKNFGRYSGFALETQHFADAINHSHFPSIVLNPDESFYQKTVYHFGILED